MSFEYGYKWLNNRESIVKMIEELAEDLQELKKNMIELEEDAQLFEEGDYLEHLYILLEGEVKLIKKGAEGTISSMVTDYLKPGSFIGLIAFTTGNRTMTGAKVIEKGRAIRVKREEFDDYLRRHNRLSFPMQQLMIANLVDRYQQNTALQLKLEKVNTELKDERNELQKAYRELEEAQNLLVHKEKMATLGQLVAGFAHEINNPVSSLLRSSESVVRQLSRLFAEEDVDEFDAELFKAGLNASYRDTATLRESMQELRGQFPALPRTLLRKMAMLPPEIISEIRDQCSAGEIEKLLARFEAGKLLHNIRHASRRIANLVKSLKNYSRQDKNTYELMDLREGLQDTILMLSNRLKHHEVVLELKEIPETCGNMGELNQVWTNIIINACDAMEHHGTITIGCRSENDHIRIVFRDTGPGVPEKIQDRIFEPNFTTKNQSRKFGLGLGLAISNEIVKKHEGTIGVHNSEEGGAVFTVTLPVTTDCI